MIIVSYFPMELGKIYSLGKNGYGGITDSYGNKHPVPLCPIGVSNEIEWRAYHKSVNPEAFLSLKEDEIYFYEVSVD